LEVILVDDHSMDSGYTLISDFIAASDLTHFTLLTLLDGDGLSKKAALKKGIEHSIGELIITTDADCTMGENWVLSIVRKYRSDKCPMISGPVCILPGKSFFSKLQSLEFFSLIGTGAGAIAIKKPFLANGANLAFTHSLYNELNGYADHISYASGDDVFMLLKTKQKHGISFLKNKEAIVYTKALPTLKAFLFQRIRWASKSAGYNDPIAIYTALSVFLLSTFVLLSFILGLLNPAFFLMTAGLFIVKLIVDFPMWFDVTKFFRSGKLMWYYVPMQIVYAFYIISVSVLSLIMPFEWKGRKLWK
jgi:cellulose synthase/poly-beta-1,6-N-acetylglucosamine synthase-like glycosyltransferase